MIFPVEPVFNYRTWGGNYLRDCFKRLDLPDNIGEVFLVSAITEADSQIDGVTLSAFYQLNPQYFGLSLKEFPLRINIIDAADDLSIQLHPLKKNLKDYPEMKKGVEEAWYIIKTQPESQLILGLSTEDIKVVETAIANNNWSSIINSVKPQAKDFVFLPAGFVHAIGKGNLVFEVTYNIDITYRLYDYDRLDIKTQQLRPLHYQEGLDNLNLKAKGHLVSSEEKSIVTLLNQKPGFIIEKIDCKSEETINQDNFYFYTVVSGQGTIDGIATTLFGTYFVPKTQSVVKLQGKMEILRVSFTEN